MRLNSLAVAAAAALFASDALAQYETPTSTATPEATATPAMAPEATPVPTAAPSPAPEKKKPEITTGAEKLKVGGTLWPIYRFDLSEGAEDKNEFDVGRAYITLAPTLADNLDGRITIDVVPQAAGSTPADEEVTDNTTGSLMFRLKYGYITYRPMPMLELVTGMVPTPWVGYEEEVYGYRLLGETGADKYFGIKSSDFGYGAKLKAWNGRVVLHSQAQNGESYTKREVNKYKEIATAASVQILPAKEGGLKLAAFYSYALNDENVEKARAIGMLSWQSKMFMGMAGYLTATGGGGGATRVDGGGPFAAGYVNVPFALPGAVGTRVIARVDMADPDVDVEDDSITRITAGISILCHEKAQVVLDYQQESYESSDVDPKKLAFVHWDLRF